MNGNPQTLHQMAHNAGEANYWFTTTNPDGSPIFVAPAPFTFVTQPGVRNAIHVPGFENWNIGLFKRFAINERMGFQFRAEAFNAFNHPNWLPPSFDPTSSNFGKVTGKSDDVRQLQLSLRFYF